MNQSAILPSSELVRLLREFTKRQSKNSQNNPKRIRERTENAALLLPFFPPAKDSILEFYSKTISDKIKSNYHSSIKVQPKIEFGDIEKRIFESLQQVFESNWKFWSIILAEWSLKLLIQASVNLPIVTATKPSSTVQLMASRRLECPLLRQLFQLFVKCLTKLIQSDRTDVVTQILKRCIDRSPHSDWILAEVGNRQPKVVATKIIEEALEDFTKNQDIIPVMKSDRFVSTVGILGYLSANHSECICDLLLGVFDSSLESDTGSAVYSTDFLNRKIATVPFLLLLFSFNFNLCSSLMYNFHKSVTMTKLRTIVDYSSHWITYFGTFKVFKCWLVQIVTRFNSNSLEIIELLIECHLHANENSPHFNAHEREQIRKYSWYLLISLLQQLQKESCPMLESLNAKSKKRLIEMLFDLHVIRREIAARLLLVIGSYNEPVLVEICCFLLRNSGAANEFNKDSEKNNGSEQIRLLIQLVANADILCPNNRLIYESVVSALRLMRRTVIPTNETAIAANSVPPKHFWSNLLALLQLEYAGKLPFFKAGRIETAIGLAFADILSIFDAEISDRNRDCAQYIFRLLCTLKLQQMQSSLAPIILLRLADKLLDYFSFVLTLNESNKEAEINFLIEIVRKCCRISKIVNEFVIRELLYRSLYTSSAMLFGSKAATAALTAKTQKLRLSGTSDDIWKSFCRKRKLNPSSDFIRKHFKAYENYFVRVRPNAKYPSTSDTKVGAAECGDNVSGLHLQKEFLQNRRLLIKMIETCSQQFSTGTSAVDSVVSNVPLHSTPASTPMDSSPFGESNCAMTTPTAPVARMIRNALILVELLCPDVMYNGLPWPDEEFTKITMERDLTIYRAFVRSPIIHDYLQLLAIHRPAACFTSVLFRAVLAIIIRTWSSIGHQKALILQVDKIRSLVSVTIQILDLMTLAELLPRPICYLRDILVNLKPLEISYVLLDCVWNYTKGNVPSPLLYSYNWNTIQWRNINAIRPHPVYTDTMMNCIQSNIEILGPYYNYMFLYQNERSDSSKNVPDDRKDIETDNATVANPVT